MNVAKDKRLADTGDLAAPAEGELCNAAGSIEAVKRVNETAARQARGSCRSRALVSIVLPSSSLHRPFISPHQPINPHQPISPHQPASALISSSALISPHQPSSALHQPFISPSALIRPSALKRAAPLLHLIRRI